VAARVLGVDILWALGCSRGLDAVGCWDRRGGRHMVGGGGVGGGDVGGGGGSIDRRCCACIYRVRVHNATEGK